MPSEAKQHGASASPDIGDVLHEGPAEQFVQDAAGRWPARLGCSSLRISDDGFPNQVVDAICDQVSSLPLFQRQPHWLLAHLTFYNQWLRLTTYWGARDTIYGGVRADRQFMKSHHEAGRFGVTANTLALGHQANLAEGKMPAEVLEQIFATIPIGRLGDPLEVGAACAYLASEEVAGLTGQTIDFNGGSQTR